MQRYNDFKVMGSQPELGQIDVFWFDNTRGPDGKLLTPLNKQNVLFQSHRVPVEAEENNWTREQLRMWWVNEVDDVADIPQWAEDEVGKFTFDQLTRVRVTKA